MTVNCWSSLCLKFGQLIYQKLLSNISASIWWHFDFNMDFKLKHLHIHENIHLITFYTNQFTRSRNFLSHLLEAHFEMHGWNSKPRKICRASFRWILKLPENIWPLYQPLCYPVLRMFEWMFILKLIYLKQSNTRKQSNSKNWCFLPKYRQWQWLRR